ncbi:MAG: hypothetical protein ACXACB_02585, partial [Promethearchaeota archaeon]
MRAKSIKNPIFNVMILILTLCFIIPFFSNPLNGKLDKDQEYAFNDITELEKASISPNGKPLTVNQYANISKSYIGDEFPKNISFNLAPEWTSKNVSINYEGVSRKKDWVTNGNFDTNMSGWNYKYHGGYWSNDGYYDSTGNPPGSVGFRASEMGGENYAYYEQNISISENFGSGNAVISADVQMAYSAGRFNGSIFISLIIDNDEKNNTIHCESIETGVWVPLNLIYDPVSYGHILPNNVSLRIGVYGWEDDSIVSWQSFYFDNIKCEFWTKPNISNILIATDNEFNQNYTYINTANGEGHSFIDTERYRSISDEITFTIHNNMTDALDLKIDTITINSFAEKSKNSTVLGIPGSEYIFGSNINWHSELSISSVPPDYTSWVEVEKPFDWLFTQIIDGYEAEQTENCLGLNYGSSKVIIPSSILGPGLWKFDAVSMNYMNDANLEVWDSSSFEPTTQLTFGELFQMSITLNDTISLSNTLLNCSIFYPNGSVFWKDSKEPSSYTESFGNFTIAGNMTVGKYNVKVKWANSQNLTSIDKVGYQELNFRVWHHSNLSAETAIYEIVSGEPLLVKAKLTDTDVNSTIAFATLTYNSTFGQTGTMLYQGSGTYLADIDTSSLELGSYFISVNATTDYYENQSIVNLIQVNVVSQSLVMDVPHTIIEAIANNYVICQVNVTGALSGTLIWPANISANWQNHYSVVDHFNGTYSLNFSTYNLPSIGIVETYTISVYANKTNYGSTIGYLTITIHPIQTLVNVNTTLITTEINEIFEIKVNYTAEVYGNIILGANCSVTWIGQYEVTPEIENFIIKFDTKGIDIDSYTAIIKLEKPGYETAFKSLTVVIK